MKFKIVYLLIGVFALSVSAQDGMPVYSDYLTDNLYLIHPAMAGASYNNQIRLTTRQQWFDVDNAPSLQTLTANMRLNDEIGLGGTIFNDKNGNYSQLGVYGTFSYHLLLSRNIVDLNQLSFGLSVGIIQNKLDETGFDLSDYDPLIGGNELVDRFFNMDIGASYYFLKFFAHATIKNLVLANRHNFDSPLETRDQRRFIISSGYLFSKYFNAWSFEPSFMLQYLDETEEALVDANLKVYHNFEWGHLYGGLSYRMSLDGADYLVSEIETKKQKLQYVTPFVGINFNKMVFAYTYSYQNNTVVLSNGGYHQLTLGYDFGNSRKPKEFNFYY